MSAVAVDRILAAAAVTSILTLSVAAGQASRPAREAPAEKPRLWVLMEEQAMGIFGTQDFVKPGQAETTLMEEFKRMGYKVVDSATVRRNIEQAKGLRALEGDTAAAAAIGLQYGAEFAVMGTSHSKPAGGKIFDTQMQTLHATVTARIIRNSDARVVAVGSASAAQAHVDEVRGGALAIEKASRELAGNLDRRLAIHSSEDEDRGRETAVHLSGLKSYRHLDFVVTRLETQIEGVESVKLKNFTTGVAELALRYRGELKLLAGQLAREAFLGFRLEPTHVASNRIDIKVILDAPTTEEN